MPEPQAVVDTHAFQMHWMVVWSLVNWRRDHNGDDASEIRLNPRDWEAFALPNGQMFGVHAVADEMVEVGCARLS